MHALENATRSAKTYKNPSYRFTQSIRLEQDHTFKWASGQKCPHN